MTAQQICRPCRQAKKLAAPRVLRYAALVALALLVVATLPRAAAAKYGSPSSSVVGTSRRGAVLSSPRGSARGGAWTRGSARPGQDERVRRDGPWRANDLPLLAGRNPGYRNLGGTALRSSVRPLATRTALLQRPLRDISARPVLQRAAACRQSASQSHQLRAPPSFAL